MSLGYENPNDDKQRLNDQQQWLFSQIMSGSKPSNLIQTWITSSEDFPAPQRLAIYQSGYKLRLLECMQAEFPILRLYLGDEVFGMFALGYIQSMPSKHYSLYELGANFPSFLKHSRPPLEALTKSISEEMVSYMALPEQLAELERAQACSIRARGNEDAPSHLSTVQFMSWPSLSLPSTSQLVDVEFDLIAYLKSAEMHLTKTMLDPTEHLEKPIRPDLAKQTLLVFRERYRVNIVRLQDWQAIILKAIASEDAPNWPFIADQCQLPEYELLLRLNLWLPEAIRLHQVSLMSPQY